MQTTQSTLSSEIAVYKLNLPNWSRASFVRVIHLSHASVRLAVIASCYCQMRSLRAVYRLSAMDKLRVRADLFAKRSKGMHA